jgi:hypothetical protein
VSQVSIGGYCAVKAGVDLILAFEAAVSITWLLSTVAILRGFSQEYA